ncbi:hypothetical protein Clacol_007768 [Clathrus columnatus]|uniref:Uncharacterized protein n=1 Tax=Clathrus columnatus TaxID=1419009 RepID=A0AAV5AFV0_9AGAM|nr:hypothetical protein Clacol_007768 [Clathrus columnatus]
MSLTPHILHPHGLPNTTDEMEWKRKVAQGFALSKTLNIRNTEHEWYAFWNQIGFELIAGTHNLILFPQFSSWYGDGDRPNPPSNPRILPLPATKVEVEGVIPEGPEGSMASVTDDSDIISVSSAATTPLPQKLSASCYPDFAILRVTSREVSQAHYPLDVQVVTVTVKLLIEIKQSTSRQLLNVEDENFHHAVTTLITTAHQDVQLQAAITFARHHHLQSLRCIAASGDYWQHALIKRTSIPQDVYEYIGLKAAYPGDAKFVPHVWIPSSPVKTGDQTDVLQFQESRFAWYNKAQGLPGNVNANGHDSSYSQQGALTCGGINR